MYMYAHVVLCTSICMNEHSAHYIHILYVQAVWRGRRVRLQQASRAVERARERVRLANCSAQKSQTVKNRLPHILEQLKKCKFLSSLADILRVLGTYMYVVCVYTYMYMYMYVQYVPHNDLKTMMAKYYTYMYVYMCVLI